MQIGSINKCFQAFALTDIMRNLFINELKLCVVWRLQYFKKRHDLAYDKLQHIE